MFIWWRVRQIRSRDVRKQLRAIEGFARSGDVRAIPALVAALSDAHPSVRQAASQVLVKIGSPAIDPLIRTLAAEDAEFTDGDLRRSAVVALVKIGPAAVEPLIATLSHEDRKVRAVAAHALGLTGDERAVVPLVRALGHTDPLLRQKAAEALGRLRNVRAVEPLARVLGDREKDPRQAAAFALGRFRDPRAVDVLVPMLTDSNPRSREEAAAALGKIADPPSIAALIGALNSDLDDTRDAATVELARIAGPAVQPLIEALRLRQWRARRGAAQLLGQIGDSSAVAPLVLTLSDTDSLVRRQAADSLRQLHWQPLSARERAQYAIAIGDFEAAIQEGADAVAPLTDALNDGDYLVRRQAEDALQRLSWSPTTAEERVLRAIAAGHFDDASREGPAAVVPIIRHVRVNGMSIGAATALGQIGDGRAVETLIQALENDRYTAERLAAAIALGKIRDSRAMEPLLDYLAGLTDPAARNEVTNALARIGITNPRFLRPLLQRASDASAASIPEAVAVLQLVLERVPAECGFDDLQAIAALNIQESGKMRYDIRRTTAVDESVTRQLRSLALRELDRRGVCV